MQKFLQFKTENCTNMYYFVKTLFLFLLKFVFIRLVTKEIYIVLIGRKNETSRSLSESRSSHMKLEMLN